MSTVRVPVTVTDITRASEYQAVLPILPPQVRALAERFLYRIDEVKMDAGKQVQIRINDLHIRYDVTVAESDLRALEIRVGNFKSNGRKGVAGTTHRVASGLNDMGVLDKVTFRVGRLLRGVAEPFRDLAEAGKGLGMCGKPGSGKTTFIRDYALISGEYHGFGVNVVDTSNEILGEGADVIPAFAGIRQDKVGEPENLVPTLKRAVRSHGTQVLILDEVGYQAGDVELVLQADRFGPTVTSSVHGNTLGEVLDNTLLQPMFGVREDAHGRKEQVGLPAFGSFLEVRARDHFVLHRSLADSVARILAGQTPETETYLYDFQGA